MNPNAAERIARQRHAELRAEAARSRPAGDGSSIRSLTGWALVQIGLTLVTSSARSQRASTTARNCPEPRADWSALHTAT
jgi:hypothetical protein